MCSNFFNSLDYQVTIECIISIFALEYCNQFKSRLKYIKGKWYEGTFVLNILYAWKRFT